MTEPEPAAVCVCGRTTQVNWSHTFGRFYCPDCRRVAVDRELDQPVTVLPPEDPSESAVAFCPPGQATGVEAALAARGESVREVREHPFLAGMDAAFLVADAPEPPPLSTVLTNLLCPRCGWLLPQHSIFCALFPWSAVIPPAGPLVTGLPSI